MKQNPERKSSLVSVVIAAIGIVIMFVPAIVGMEGMDGGYAVILLGVVVIITGIVAFFVYTWRAKKLDAMLGGKNLLVHWTYSQDEWRRYTEKAHEDKKSASKVLFFIISGFAIVIGAGFFIKDPDSGKYVFLAMLGLIVIIGFVALLTTMLDYRRNKKNLGEAYVATDGIYLNGVLHTWKGLATHLDNVVYEEDARSLIFTYVALDRIGLHSYTVRVPVPQGQEAKASELLAQFKSRKR